MTDKIFIKKLLENDTEEVQKYQVLCKLSKEIFFLTKVFKVIKPAISFKN